MNPWRFIDLIFSLLHCLMFRPTLDSFHRQSPIDRTYSHHRRTIQKLSFRRENRISDQLSYRSVGWLRQHCRLHEERRILCYSPWCEREEWVLVFVRMWKCETSGHHLANQRKTKNLQTWEMHTRCCEEIFDVQQKYVNCTFFFFVCTIIFFSGENTKICTGQIMYGAPQFFFRNWWEVTSMVWSNLKSARFPWNGGK